MRTPSENLFPTDSPLASKDLINRKADVQELVDNASARVSYLLAGSIGHLMQGIFRSQEPLGYFGGFHYLSSITTEECTEGLQARLAQDKTTIDAHALDQLLELSAQHPRTTMLLAQQAHLDTVLSDSYHITSKDIIISYRKAYKREHARYQAMINEIRLLGGKKNGKIALQVIKHLSHDKPPYQNIVQREKYKISRALDSLRDAGFIYSKENHWQIVEPLFKKYVADMWSINN